jgi:hypothetical protein
MIETVEPLSTRVVRAVHQVHPRWLTGKEVREAFPDERDDIVYATISNNAKDNKGPLRKRRREQSGVLEYSTIDGFDLDRWIEERRAARRNRSTQGDSLDVCVTIVQALRQHPDRLTADELESTGRFKDRREMLLNIKQLCDDGEPLMRERRGGADAAPFEYGFKPGYDVEEWLRERGASGEPCAPGDAPALGYEPAPAAAAAKPAATDPKTATPSPPPAGNGAAPARAAAPSTAAPQAPQTARPGRGATEAGTRKVEPATSVKDTRVAAPAAAAGPPEARTAHGRDTRDEPTPATPPPPVVVPRRFEAAPVPAAATPKAQPTDAPTPAAPNVVAPVAASPKAQAIPSPRGDRARVTSHDDLATELVIISAACLATAVRAHVAGIDKCPELERALQNFEQADRAFLRARREKQPQERAA